MTLLTGRGAVYTRIDDALARSGEMAMQAYCQETFSVGGVLLDSNGQELMLMHNNVVIERFTYDPTAHGERQLVDWYFEQIAAGVALPPAEEMTVVTSLDPCCMCTGALLRAGFKVIVGAFDRFSGINYNTEANYPSLTNEQRSRALANFSYPQATGESCFVRPATSAQPPMFFIDQATTDKTLALCESIFTTSLNSVQQQISNDLPPEALCDPATLPDDHPVVAALRAVYPQSLTYRAPSRGQPDVALANFMIPVIEQDRQRGGKGMLWRCWIYLAICCFACRAISASRQYKLPLCKLPVPGRSYVISCFFSKAKLYCLLLATVNMAPWCWRVGQTAVMKA
ncbi:nucleoside deaminase [Pantoea sp. LMR881]|uniref:nucleoside deaminase n=1 Tax=Pantoea sp. LMR881 TaxID=3014336 RepID=UPI0022AE979B|nr:nucleoside deaminase [Pantoea sp. LMR881]MCZ4059587.1 nucleoside deaminase [Pantoea sp. LMR881]